MTAPRPDPRVRLVPDARDGGSPPLGGPPPPDLHVRLAPDTLVRGGGSLLVGGAPSRVIRLAPAAAPHVARWRGGGRVGDGVPRALARRLLDAGILVPDPAHAGLGEVAVVVPVHGREAALARCLDAIARTAPGAPVLVVDDGSPEPAAIAAVAAARGAAVVRHPECRGPSAARNTGVVATTAPVVVFVDSDIAVEPGCVARLAGHFGDPATGAVAPRVLAAEDGPGIVAAYEARHSSLDMGRRPGRVAPWSRVSYVPSATLAVRRAAVADGFDERLTVGEDVDLVWRIDAAGWNVWYDATATVRHDHRVTLRAFAGRRFAYATSIGLLATRHPAALPALHADMATGVVALALARRPWLAAALAGTLVVRLHRNLRARTTQPMGLAALLAGRSLLRAGRSVAMAIRRPWWPLVAVAAVRHPRAGLLLPAAWACGLAEARPRRPSHAALAVADDLLSGAGTWWSCARHRTARPLLPAMPQAAVKLIGRPPVGRAPRRAAG